MKPDPSMKLQLLAQRHSNLVQDAADTAIARKIDQLGPIPRCILDKLQIVEMLPFLNAELSSASPSYRAMRTHQSLLTSILISAFPSR